MRKLILGTLGMPDIGTENKRVKLFDFVGFLETRVLEVDAMKGSKAYKAVCSFLSFLGADKESPLTDLETVLLDWMITLGLRELAFATAFSYLKAISGLYTRAVKEGLASPSEAFSTAKARIKKVENVWNDGLTTQDFKSFQTIVKAISHKETGVSVEADLILMALLYGAKPIMEVANLKKSDIESDDATLRLIAKRQLGDSTRQYIFPLMQGKTTPEKFFRSINERLISFFNDRALRWFGDADVTVSTYWAYAAVLVGVRPHVVMSAIDKAPDGLPVLKCLDDRQSAQSHRPEIAAEVSKMFTTNPKRWYAMHLRQRVTIDDIDKKFESLKSFIDKPELFYPCEELRRHIGKKVVFREKPFINDIVFFNCRYTDIAPMFYQIGGLAWCITTGGKGTSYAPISQGQFERFQQAIGVFTSDYTIKHNTDALLKSGDEVVVLGGSCIGATGTILKVEQNDPDGIVSYLISICNELTDNFKATIDSRQVRKLAASDK